MLSRDRIVQIYPLFEDDHRVSIEAVGHVISQRLIHTAFDESQFLIGTVLHGQVSELIPISLLLENMRRAHRNDAVRRVKFWWNDRGAIQERTMEEIWCSPGGLLDVCRSELSKGYAGAPCCGSVGRL
mmetsp:Transcript_21132/g.20862  ORF Transcript_21132/g.20862 Transcript_21132/m.20862 type:complete len:128 (-) Transcript_21132:9-392(-)